MSEHQRNTKITEIMHFSIATSLLIVTGRRLLLSARETKKELSGSMPILKENARCISVIKSGLGIVWKKTRIYSTI